MSNKKASKNTTENKTWTSKDRMRVVFGLVTITVACFLVTRLGNIPSDKSFLVVLLGFASLILLSLGGTLAATTIWKYTSAKHQEYLQKVGYTIGAIAVISTLVFGRFIVGGQGWSGEGAVNLFPTEGSSENYRVLAEIRVETGWWGSREYEVREVTWPDGETTSFSDCLITRDNSICTDNGSREWNVEIYDAPDYDPPAQ